MENKNTIWMPKDEYLIYQETMEKLSQEQKIRMAYFFWNNFSEEGYEEWKLKQDENGKEKEDKTI